VKAHPPIDRPMPDPGGTDAINLMAPILALWRRKWLIGAVAAVVATLGVLAALALPTTFSATASVIVDSRRQSIVDIRSVVSQLDIDDASVRGEVAALTSTYLLSKVVETLRLDQDPEFNPSLGAPPAWRRMIEAILGSDPDAGEGVNLDVVIARLRRSLAVEVVNNSTVIDITATVLFPRKAALIANTLAQLYIDQQVNLKIAAAQRAADTLRNRLDALATDVARAETRVQEFQTAQLETHGQSVAVTRQQLLEIGVQLARVTGERTALEARKARLDEAQGDPAALASLPEVVDSDLIQTLRARVIDLQAREAQMLTRFGPRHPEAERVRAELDDQRAALNREIGAIAAALGKRTETARETAAALTAAMRTLEAKVIRQETDGVELTRRMAEVEAARSVYVSFLGRWRETSAIAEFSAADSRIVSAARVPNNSSGPPRKLIAAMAGVLGLALGAALALVLNLLDQRLRSAEDVRAETGLRVLGQIPLLRGAWLRAPLSAMSQRRSSAPAEYVRDLRTLLAQEVMEEGVEVIAITSPLVREGKSTTTLLLAASFAETGARVLVIEGDVRRCNVGRLAGVSVTVGLRAALTGAAPLHDAVVQAPHCGLWVLAMETAPVSTPTPASGLAITELMQGDGFQRILDQARQDYDVVLIDMPPAMPLSDARVLARLADGVIMLARWDSTPRRALRRAVTRLQAARARVLGVTLTYVDFERRAGETDEPDYRNFQSLYAGT